MKGAKEEAYEERISWKEKEIEREEEHDIEKEKRKL